MNRFLIILCFISGVYGLNAQNPGDVVVNEIMYAPTPSTIEWFEIYNKSASPVNLSNWKWKEATGTLHTITTLSITLNPGSYALICQDSSGVKTAYPGLTGLVLQSSGWNPLNNTGGDEVVLISQTSVTMDSVHYSDSWGGAGNKSLERISVTGPSNQQTNWGTSVAAAGATPNFFNSISPLNNDLMLNIISFSNSNPVIGTTLQITANVKNRGQLPANTYSVSFYEDYNEDSISTVNELITSVNSANPLNSGDSINFNANDLLDSLGLRLYIAKVIFTADEDTLNNKKIGAVNVITSGGFDSLVINEIMYAPITPGGEEWFEIYNKTSHSVNLSSWKWKDATATIRTITTQNISILPGGFAVICEDSSAVKSFYPNNSGIYIQSSGWNALNNSPDDDVILINPSGTRIDSVHYFSAWGGNSGNKSLERKSVTGPSNQQSNWSGSVDCNNATPDKVNSITNLTSYLPKDLVVNEIMSSPLTGEAEWVELYNPTNKTINLASWMIHDADGNKTITDTCSALVKPGTYVIIADDDTIYSRFPYLQYYDSTYQTFISGSLGLNNEGDLVKITDLLGTTIDSVFYSDDWYNPNLSTSGRSLEKINPGLNGNDAKSWSSCTNGLGGTPGKKNTIFTNLISTGSQVTISPNPFSPDNDGFEDFCIISYKLSNTVSQLRLKIYDVKGRLLRTLLNNAGSGSTGEVVFDGFDDDKRKLRLGIYIVFLESLNDRNGVVETIKATVVVAAKL